MIQLARRIKLEVSTDLDEKYGRVFVADVTVHYSDGTSEHIFRRARDRAARTSRSRREQHQAKLDELTEDVIGKRQASQLFDLIERLPPTTPVREVTSLLHQR